MTVSMLLIVLALVFAILAVVPGTGSWPWLAVSVILICVTMLLGAIA